MLAFVLRLSLLQKLLLVDLLVNIAAFMLMGTAPLSGSNLGVMATALLLTMLLNGVMVYWSLQPLHLLESTAERVARGNLRARMPHSRLSDRHILRIGRTFNQLLDRLVADQERVRYLSAQAIGAADAERAHLARELHDSTAQSLSAVEMLLSVTCQELPSCGSTPDHDNPLKQRLQVMRDVVSDALQEVRTLAHRVHPSALEHLGLEAALRLLVARTLAQNRIAHQIDVRIAAPLSPPVASVLYRVAQEAIGNAMRHGAPQNVRLQVQVDELSAELVVEDDGRGFDLQHAERQGAGMGLFVMRERLMLVGGHLQVLSRVGGGAAIRAHAPNPGTEPFPPAAHPHPAPP